MGEAVQSKGRRKIILALLVISLFIFSVPQIYSGNSLGLATKGSSDQSADVGSALSPPSDPVGPPRPVNESAIGIDRGAGSGWPTNLPSAGTKDLPVTLKYQWVGNKLYTTVTGLWDERNWISNGNFASDSNGWSFWSRDAGSANTITSGWSSSGAGGNPGYVWAQINGRYSGGFYYYDARDTIAWNQTLTVPRGTVISARLDFKYYVVNRPMLNTLGANIYGWVGSNWAFNISYPSISVPYDSWHSASVGVPVSQITLPNILVSIGHYQIGSYGYSSLDYVRVYFDEVQLTVKAYVKPEQIKLKLAPSDSPNINCSIISPSPSTYGRGNGTLTGFTTIPAPDTQTTYYFDFISNVTSPATGYLLANATIYVSRSSTVQTSFDNQGAKVKWQWPIVTQFAMYDEAVSTTHYTKYYFNTSVPSNWAYTNCFDPSGNPHSIPTTNFDEFTLGSVKILRVNVTAVGLYSSGLNGYAPYRVNAESENYVKEVFTQKYTGGIWENETTFKPNDYMRVVGFIASPTGVRANSGTANMSSWYGTPAATWKPLNQTIPSNGWANFTFPIPNAMAFASNYTVQVAWLNQTSGETQAGVGTSAFQLIRDAQINSYIPVQDQLIAQNELFTISIVLVDKIDQTVISDAVAQYRVAWKGGPQSLAWNSLGSNYTAQERIPTTAHGVYWINITTTRSYYTPISLNISIYVTYATQATPQNQYQSVQWGTMWFNFTSTYYSIYPASAPITGATISCQTTYWQNRTLFKESQTTNGSYDVSILTQGIVEDTYGISFMVWNAVPDYQPQTIYLTLVVTTIPTSSLDSFLPTAGGDLVADSLTVTSGETALMLFSYTDTVGNGITDASLTYTADFGSGQLFAVAGRPGYYMLNITTGNIEAASHGVTVTAQKTHYTTQTKSVTIQVRAPGLPISLLIGGSLGSAGLVVGIFGAYWYIRRARIPFIVKKIDESLKLIGKGDHEAATPVALRSREELVVGITQERIDVFGRRPVGPEAEEGAAEAALAPTPETTALKKELEAVEPKEKSGEVIEEVEMDTLDEELQKLEKFEDKEKLPDGAKEVRDVVEKYKQSRKKKE